MSPPHRTAKLTARSKQGWETCLAPTRSTRRAPRQSVVPRLLRVGLRAPRAGLFEMKATRAFSRLCAPHDATLVTPVTCAFDVNFCGRSPPPSAGCARSAPPCCRSERRSASLRCSRPTIPSPPTPASSSSDSSRSRNPPDRVATRRTRSARGRRPGRLTSDHATESGGQLRIVPLQRRILGPQDESRVPARCQSATAECLPPHSPSPGRPAAGMAGAAGAAHRCDRGPGAGQTRCAPEPPALVSAHQSPGSPRDGATALQVGVGVAAIRAETPAKDDP